MDDVYNLTRTAAQITALNPDLIGLQEVDNMTARHAGDDQTLRLSQMTGMTTFVFAKQRNFQGGGYGVAVLSRYPIEDVMYLYYHKPSGRQGQSAQGWVSSRTPLDPPANCTDPVEGDYCQGAVAIKVTLPNQQKLWFATTHLGIGLHDQQQAVEASQLVDWARGTVAPTGIPLYQTGDFNSVPTDPAVMAVKNSRLFRDAFVDCGVPPGSPGFTFSSGDPNRRIDYLFMTPIAGAKCSQSKTVPTLASDHLPLITDVAFQ